MRGRRHFPGFRSHSGFPVHRTMPSPAAILPAPSARSTAASFSTRATSSFSGIFAIESWGSGIGLPHSSGPPGVRKRRRPRGIYSGLSIQSIAADPQIHHSAIRESTYGSVVGCALASSAQSSCHWRREFASLARAPRECAPCFQRARWLRRAPAAVLGPVLLPPCIRQRRRFRIAGH